MRSVKLNFFKLAPSGSHNWHDDPSEWKIWVVVIDEADSAVWNQVGHFADPQTLDMILDDLLP